MDQSRRKQYVEVVAIHCIDGDTYPTRIILADGPTYEIERARVLGPVRLPSGALATRYQVRIRGKKTHLFEDHGRWFVLMKENMRARTAPGKR